MAQRGTDAAHGVVVDGTSGAEAANSAGADVQDGGGLFSRKQQNKPSGMITETDDIDPSTIERLKAFFTGKRTVPVVNVVNNGQPAFITLDSLIPGFKKKKLYEIRVINQPKTAVDTHTSGLSGVSSVSRFQGVYGGDVLAQMKAELRRHGKGAVDDFRKLLKAVGDKAIKTENREAHVIVEEGNETLAAVNFLISK